MKRTITLLCLIALTMLSLNGQTISTTKLGSFVGGITVTLLASELLQSLPQSDFDFAIDPSLPETATFTITAWQIRREVEKMRNALWYYDNYFVVKKERDAYKTAYAETDTRIGWLTGVCIVEGVGLGIALLLLIIPHGGQS